MALIDNPSAWILRLFEMEEREGRGANCERFPKGSTPAGIPLNEGERIYGIYKEKYFFSPESLFIKESTNLEQIRWKDILRCSTRHGDGKKYSEILLVDGRAVRIRIGDMAQGWSGRVSQLYHQLIERHGARAAFGPPLVPWREFFLRAPSDFSVAPNLEPHPDLDSFQQAFSELENEQDGTQVFMILVDEEEWVADGLAIVTPRPEEYLQRFVGAFRADGLFSAEENVRRKLGDIRANMNVWQIVWD